MGCTQSKIENEEAVSRCKERKQFMKDAVASRNAFAAAHCSYAMSLKNTGAALSDYAQGEVQNPHSTPPSSSAAAAAATIPSQTPFETLPPPPPPIPADIAPPPLQRAVSMPEFVVSKPSVHPSEPIIEEEDEDEIENEGGGSLRGRSSRSGRRGGGDGGVGSAGGGGRNRLEEDGPPPPPSPPPETPPPTNRAPPPPPPPPGANNSTWDFLFDVDNMPGGSLGDVENMRREREEMERKVLEDERAKRSGDIINAGEAVVGGEGSSRNRKVENAATPEAERVVEKPPLPPQQAAGTGKIGKRSKQVVGAGTGGEGKRIGKYVNLLHIFNDLDDCFLEASESAHEVSKMLEAARLHYHSNFANNRGHIDHSTRLMRVITWNRSFRGLHNAEEVKDDFDSEENETHATVLDKLLAWEKKLYDEVKAGELMKFEYQRKVGLLNKQKKRGTNPEALEKTKAAVSHLHTRYIVDMQSLDSTVSEISRLRDEQLYPKLVALVDAMATMWESMQVHHNNQYRNMAQLKGVDISQSTKETTEHHHQRTVQLWLVVQEWHAQFEKMVNHQKEYIRALNNWLKLNLIPIESSLKEKVSSPPRAQRPPIQAALITWDDCLEKLPEELAKGAIYNFEALLHNLVQQQADELKLKARCEESRKDVVRKKRQFEDWYNKYTQRGTPSEETDPDRPEDTAQKDIVAEKHFVVESAEKKLEEDDEAYSKHCTNVREKSLVSLKTQMPELFRAMVDFSHSCSEMYRDLSSILQDQKHNETSS